MARRPISSGFTTRIEHTVLQDEPPAKPDDPLLWTNKMTVDFARKKGWNWRNRHAIRQMAQGLGIETPIHAVSTGLIRSIAANLAAHGGL